MNEDSITLKFSDPHGRVGIRAYAGAVKNENEALAKELVTRCRIHEPKRVGIVAKTYLEYVKYLEENPTTDISYHFTPDNPDMVRGMYLDSVVLLAAPTERMMQALMPILNVRW